MPPVDMDSIPCQLEPSSSFKTFDKAMELPILHDAFTIALKLHEQATHFPTYNQVESMVSNGIQILDAELSEEVKTGVARAVLSLDCFISSGLDKLTATVPSLANPTDKIFPSLKLADYILAFFGLSIHQEHPPQETQNEAMGVIEATEELIISSDRCPGIENLSKEECRLCSSTMLLCSNLPHLPYVSKEHKDAALDVIKESQVSQDEDTEVIEETQESEDDSTEVTQDEAKELMEETKESKDATKEDKEETKKSQSEAMEVTKQTPDDFTEVPVKTKEFSVEYNEIMKDTEETLNDATDVIQETLKFFKETTESQHDATEVTEKTKIGESQNDTTEVTDDKLKFFKETEESQQVSMEETEVTQVTQKDVMEVTEFIEVVDVIGAFEVVDVVEAIEFIQVIDN